MNRVGIRRLLLALLTACGKEGHLLADLGGLQVTDTVGSETEDEWWAGRTTVSI